MVNKVDVKSIVPKQSMVLVKLMKIPNSKERGVFMPNKNDFKHDPNNPLNYFGKVIAIGPDVTQIKKGDYVLYSMAADYIVLTKDEKNTYKLVDEDNVSVYSKMSGMKVESVMTLGDRILVDETEEKKELESKGVYIPDDADVNYGTERDLSKGKIVRLSKDAKKAGYKEGDVIYYPKDVGLSIDELKGVGQYRIIKPMYIKFEYRP